jgi:hypothetical protein
MPTITKLPEPERKAIQKAFELGRRALEFWESEGARLTQRYGGQWIILYGDEVLANSKDPDAIRHELERLGNKAEVAIVRYVHPPGTEFSFLIR